MTGYKIPPRRRTLEFHVTKRNTISKRLAALYRSGMSWRAIGTKFGVSGGMAFRVATQGYEPRKASIRAALGLPVTVPVAVCPIHGVVHIPRRCPTAAPGKPRRQWKPLALLLWAAWLGRNR